MADEVTDAIDAELADPASAEVDGRKVQARPIADTVEGLKFKSQAEAVSGTNASGGQKSGWRGLRIGRVRGSSTNE